MSDYERIARAIEFIAGNVEEQPSLADVARHVHLSPYHFQRLFSRWAGVSPKRFLQALTLDRAKRLLADGRLPVLEVSDALGLGSTSRLYDHFVKLDAVTPSEHRRLGRGLDVRYGVAASPFGAVFVASTPRGVCRVSFVDGPGETAARIADLSAQWPDARLARDDGEAARAARRMFETAAPAEGPLSLLVHGTNFQIGVWRALLDIAPGRLATYADVARKIGRPTAARAVGAAIGANPLAFVIPCHRVIHSSGGIGGYRWGPTRKRAIHAWEAARFG